MSNLNRIRKYGSAVGLLAMSYANVWAANTPTAVESFVAVGGDSAQIVLALSPVAAGNAAGSVLSVAFPDGRVSRQEFQGSDAPFISGPLPDGAYTYELSIIPAIDAATRKTLRAARRAADGQEVPQTVAALQAQGKIPSQPQVQSGSFMIEGGILVPSDTKE